MATINFYLDKIDKKGLAPIHLRLNCDGKQIKCSTGVKVNPKYFDKDNQMVLNTDEFFQSKNKKLGLLKQQTEDYLGNPIIRKYTLGEIKNKIKELVQSYHIDDHIQIVEDDQLSFFGEKFTFIDLFAGAGGFSEGFLQAE